MRPPGEIHQALTKALGDLVIERGAVGGREICAKASIAESDGLQTLKDLVRYGHVDVVGSFKHADSGRWHKLYEPAIPAPPARAGDPTGWASICLESWALGRPAP